MQQLTSQALKKPVSKAQLRAEMNEQIADFIRRGGSVAEIERGISGRDSAQGPLKSETMGFGEPKTDRTYVPEVVAALEARKQKPAVSKAKPRRPRKKLIYDDFGEPLRWEWVDS